MNNFEVIHTDILVIGGGGAGCAAAIEAAESKRRVTLVTKDKLTSGCTSNVKTTVVVGLKDNGDHYKIAADDLIKAGKNLGNRKLIEKLMKRSYDIFHELLLGGLEIKIDEHGHPYLKKYPGHSFERNFSLEGTIANNELGYGYFHGISIMEILKKKIKKSDIGLIEYSLLVNFLLDDNHNLHGGIFYNYVNGKYLIVCCNAAILATGSFTNIYSETKTSYVETGDGHACAYRANVELIDMEVIQFDPLSIRMAPGIKLYHDGQEFLKKYGIEEPSTVSKERLVYAISHEIQKSKTDHSITVDFRGCFDSKEKPSWFEEFVSSYWKNKKKNLNVDIVTSNPIAHTSFGGVNIDQNFQTNIEGLYAAGAVVGGLYGFARPKGFTSTIALTSGKISGEYAVANSKPRKPISDKLLNHYMSESKKYLRIDSGEDPYDLKKQLHNIVDKYSKVIKEESELKEGLNEIVFLEDKIKDIKININNFISTLNAYEALNLLISAKCHFKSSLIRKESRGAFFRKDYPELDNNEWLKNIILYNEKDEMKVRFLNKNLQYEGNKSRKFTKREKNNEEF